jgi:hypothetical protein
VEKALDPEARREGLYIYPHFADPVSFRVPQLLNERHQALRFQLTAAMTIPDNGGEEKKREGSHSLAEVVAFIDPEQWKVTEYGDTSTTYWKLYGAEAEINDKKLVDSLTGDTNSMLILVRGDACYLFTLQPHAITL